MMKDIPINNQEVLDGLNNFLWMYDEREEIQKNFRLHSQGADKDYFTGDEYRDIIVKQDTQHEGYPDEGRNYNMKPTQMEKGENPNPDYVAKAISNWTKYSTNLQNILCTRFN